MSSRPHNAFSTLSDYQARFLTALYALSVQYVVIGGYAMRFHGRDRPAKDLDLLVGCNPENADRILSVLTELGASQLEKAKVDLVKPKFKVRWYDVEMLTSIDDIDSDEACSRAVVTSVYDIKVLVASKTDLLASKIVASREEDQDDIAFLRGETGSV